MPEEHSAHKDGLDMANLEFDMVVPVANDVQRHILESLQDRQEGNITDGEYNRRQSLSIARLGACVEATAKKVEAINKKIK